MRSAFAHPVRPSSLRPIVQKFGGSSLSSLEKVRRVADKIIRTHEVGRPVVVVVSAMGDTTSELVDKARAVSSAPPGRELDMLLSSGERMSMALLSMAIHDAGKPAISLTGPQSGIVTDGNHSNATIVDVRPDRIREELARGRIVIVAGYQGATPAGEVTTLGRGGSDTTAVVLAGALAADMCEIYSDVPGIYTADPREVEGPLHLKRVGSRLMTEYARHGARVLHRPCLEHAQAHGVSIRALSTFGGAKSTVIVDDSVVEYSDAAEGDRSSIVGIASRPQLARVHSSAADATRTVAILDQLEPFDAFREVPPANHGTLDVLLDMENAPDPNASAQGLRSRLSGLANVEDNLSSVSAVADARAVAHLPSRVLHALREAAVDVLATYRHPLSVTCAVRPEQRRTAVQALHEALVASRLQHTLAV